MQQLKLYNSLTRKKELFQPISKKVGVYVCGITPYAVTHLGHAFTYTSFDVLIRYLTYTGYTTTYVQNVTDIDDDIIRVAKEQKKNWKKLGQENTRRFLADMKWLGNEAPDFYTAATDHIPEMQSIIKKLLQKKFAYEKEGNVYFDITKDKNYGKLSRLSLQEMLPIANERGNDPRDPNKKHPLDFVLWQALHTNEPSWASPWGPGRPGWHIECSAMSTKYLGQPFEIHGGGGDLLFPHHESEIAQSESAYGKPMAQFWMHTGMLRYQGEKMSKSLGNLVLVANLQKRYNANTIRIALLSHHYRKTWEFTQYDMQRAKKLNAVLKKAHSHKSGSAKELTFAKERNAFFSALDNDMNTPRALQAIGQLAQKISEAEGANTTKAQEFLIKVFHILGVTVEF